MLPARCKGVLFITALFGSLFYPTEVTAQSKQSADQSDWDYHQHGSYRYSENNIVLPHVLRRKGGIGGDKKQQIMDDKVYIALGLRRLFVNSRGDPSLTYNYDVIGVCSGPTIGLSLRNQTRIFRLFACPRVESVAAVVTRFDAPGNEFLPLYCCGAPPAQLCCDREEFFKEHGTDKRAAALATKFIILGTAIAGSLLFACCICTTVCLCVVMPMRRGAGLAKKSTCSTRSQPQQQQQQQQQEQPQPQQPLLSPDQQHQQAHRQYAATYIGQPEPPPYSVATGQPAGASQNQFNPVSAYPFTQLHLGQSPAKLDAAAATRREEKLLK